MISKEFQKTILSQYSNSNKLIAFLESFNMRIDPTVDIQTFFTEVFDLDTCGTYGLDVWGRIVAAPRGIRVQEPNFFGFRMTGFQPWGAKYLSQTDESGDPPRLLEAPFWNGQKSPATVTLGNGMYRALIYFKAAANIVNTTLPELNRLLWEYLTIRGVHGDCFVEKIAPMALRAVFKFKLSYVDRAIFRVYGDLLRPAGHELWFQEYSPRTFGFFGSNLKPWNHGIFNRGNVNDQFYQVED